jgi:DNA-binding response OmpR family regulator
MSTVLVVEDDPHTRELVRLYLDRDGHQVLTADNGTDGLEAARSESPDIVLLDLMLPGLNGWDVCQALRQDSDVPIVMLTAG